MLFWGACCSICRTFEDLKMITFTADLCRKIWFYLKRKIIMINQPALIIKCLCFCSHNCGPFWNLISWSTGSRADAILNGIIEVLTPHQHHHVYECLFIIDVPYPPRDGRCKAPLKACRKPTSPHCLIWRGGVRWARRGNTFHCWRRPLELIHCLKLLTTSCQVRC